MDIPSSPSKQSVSSSGEHGRNNGIATEDRSYFAPPPTVSLPNGGGAIKGIGEKFAANPVTGTGSMSVPIATSPGRSGFGPQLSLSYDSGAGNGTFGFGWNLSLPAITRKTDKGLPRYWDSEESDVFILSGAEDLVPFLVLNSQGEWETEKLDPCTVGNKTYIIKRYRPRIEGLFARIERWTNQSDPQDIFWRSLSKDNITTWYGKDANSRIFDPANPTHIFSWLICESYDDKGNVIVYHYKEEDSTEVDLSQVHERNRDQSSRSANRYLKQIRYGNHQPYRPELLPDQAWPTPPGAATSEGSADWFFEVVFDYGEHDRSVPNPGDTGQWNYRHDPFSSYRSGFEVRTYRLCQRVLMFHHFPNEPEVGRNCLVRSTDFNYSYESDRNDERDRLYSFLVSVTQTGYQRNSAGGYDAKSLPPLEFTYSEAQIDETVRKVDPISLENLPQGLDGTRYQWIDLDSEGIPGILTEQGGGWFYKRNLSPVPTNGNEQIKARFAPVEMIASKPAGGLSNGAQFLDLAGDGQIDLVTFRGNTPGFYERTAEADWESFVAFKSLPVLDWDNPNLKFIDLDGDGHSDILITETECFVWHRSLAEDGFDAAEEVRQPWDEEQGPRIVFADGTQSIHLADMSGDGLTDIVRIRNGEVCYWPNLGYGRFGAKVTMDNAPWFDEPDLFDQRRIQLADIDGSGTTDILYLSGEGVQIYFNQSGNRWAAKQTLSRFPAIDHAASVTVVDLLGNGTACLVWSSPLPGNAPRVMRYLDLMGGQKPHLLVKTVNNLGAETVVQYAPSTQFYLQDKLAGKPWITKLPFPVHVVEKVIVIDRWRQTRFATTYSYHHGYFDGIEREFRGFGRVEQTDVEDFGTFVAGNPASPYITDDKTLYQPPVKTITWYHTGAFLDRHRILSQVQHEYFAPQSADFTEKALPEPELTALDLSAEEWREALRACKGMMLRQEIYELDVDALERGEEQRIKLFSTAFHTCQIQRLQGQGNNRHAVFLVTESEAITYHYELNLQTFPLQPDPRIAHTLNLQIDEYGNALESVAIAYPRLGRLEDTGLPAGTAALISGVQRESHLVYTQNQFTNDAIADHHHRLRLSCEVKTYELTGILPTVAPYYTLAELRSANLATVEEIPYHVRPNRAIRQKRRVEQVRTLYFSDNLRSPLPWGQLNALGLPYETYKLALTDDLLAAVLPEHGLPGQLTPEIRRDLNTASVSGYLSGTILAERFPDLETSGQYWIRSGIAGFAEDASTHFYLPQRYTDSFDQTTRLQYDARDLYIQSSTDPVGNVTTVEVFDFRVLAPRRLQDPNGNRSEVRFDRLGMPAAMAVMDKDNQGDSVADFDETQLNPDRATLIRFFTGEYDEAEARRLLGNATARYLYYFGEQPEAGGTLTYGDHPVCAAGLVREVHVGQPGASSPLQAGFEYSDGMGTVLVKKVQAEPETEAGSLRWIATGKTILNNKGKPVKQYEPYFSSSGHRFEEPIEVGVTPILYYDAAGRQIRTEMPDGSLSRVEFSPWQVTSFDANDTVLESAWYRQQGRDRFAPNRSLPIDITGEPTATAEERAGWLAAYHANTPAQTFLDSLGRDAVAIAHNRFNRDGVITNEKYLTYTKLDIEGKPLWIQDARGNRVMEYINPPDADSDFVPGYDIAGNLLFQHSMDGGDRWMLMDATGKPFYAWDRNQRVIEDGTLVPEDRVFHTTYDPLHRPLEHRLQVNGGVWQVTERFVYGDSHVISDGSHVVNGDSYSEAQSRNLRGQVYQHFDASGVITNQKFDFKGNLLEATRQLVSTHDVPVIDWSAGSATNSLSSEIFTQRTAYDALNRMTRQENWHLPDRRPAIYTPTYNQRGLLKREMLSVKGEVTEAIHEIEYDAKGQRTRIQFGNGTETRYDYDPQTFRLRQLRTTRSIADLPFPAFHANLIDARVVQQLFYTYDPVGNITEIEDEAYEPVFFNNQRVKPRNLYTYDALYRLIEAKGRENYQAESAPPQLEESPFTVNFPVMDQALRNYTQFYTYDAVGNILRVRHVADRGSWVRNYAYADTSNRLLQTWKDDDRLNAVVYEYDTHGSLLNLNRAPEPYRLRWDYRDMMHTANLGGGGQAFYTYDAAKQRTRKRIERNNGGNTVEERLYLGGMELYRRWVGNNLVEEIETHHLFVESQRILIVENVLRTNNPTLPVGVLYRYQYSNHLGSVALELDHNAAVISYEEYHPYGTTAYRAMNAAVRATAKRYRYTGKERDEESGLYYHEARYYAPWLGKWTSTDPSGTKDGLNIYNYVHNNPIKYFDQNGKNSRTDYDRAHQRGIPNLVLLEAYGISPTTLVYAQAQQQRVERQRARQAEIDQALAPVMVSTGEIIQQRELSHWQERQNTLRGPGQTDIFSIIGSSLFGGVASFFTKDPNKIAAAQDFGNLVGQLVQTHGMARAMGASAVQSVTPSQPRNLEMVGAGFRAPRCGHDAVIEDLTVAGRSSEIPEYSGAMTTEDLESMYSSHFVEMEVNEIHSELQRAGSGARGFIAYLPEEEVIEGLSEELSPALNAGHVWNVRNEGGTIIEIDRGIEFRGMLGEHPEHEGINFWRDSGDRIRILFMRTDPYTNNR